MAEPRGNYQVIFQGLDPETTDRQKAALLVQLTASFQMNGEEAHRFLTFRNFVLHKHLLAYEASTLAARFTAIGLNVVVKPMSPGSGSLQAHGTGSLPQEMPPATAHPGTGDLLIINCPECQARVKVRDPNNVRCAMCSARIMIHTPS